MCIYVCMHTDMYICVNIHTHITNMHAYIDVYVSMHVCTYTSYTCMHT